MRKLTMETRELQVFNERQKKKTKEKIGGGGVGRLWRLYEFVGWDLTKKLKLK